MNTKPDKERVLTNVALQLLDAESMRRYGVPCEESTRDCFADPERTCEAKAMVDDLEARMKFVIAEPIRTALKLRPACPGCEHCEHSKS